MHTTAETAHTPENNRGSVRGRAQAFAETLASSHRQSESLSELAHDARNMVMALSLYCDLLEEPGVLSLPYRHYAAELRLVAASSRRLVEKLALLGKREIAGGSGPIPAGPNKTRPVALAMAVPEQPIEDLSEEVLAARNLLDALSGPLVAVTVSAPVGALPVWLTTEDLTRVLVNLVKNAGEAIGGNGSGSGSGHDSGTGRRTGRIDIELRERAGSADASPTLLLTVEDSGPGIDPGLLEAIFEPGFTTNAHANGATGAWPASHRGLGLFICRSIVEAAGGRMLAGNRGRMGEQRGGARIEIELPVRTH
ncbi:sensor histidine kinase [Terracidiphilus gabretensis]|uniref:sensor histidine kinase n=1 Tax=Terracidiphilus gabretensis TaxID=1577687 RepID=UPI00071BD591|nr:HAMP domain-containing sensor histidine kinase [Terracidiphilus gabretensis]